MDAAPEPVQAVTFVLASETYGAPVAQVQEIVAWAPPIRLPHAPAWVEGLIDLRGRLLPVIDLRKRFDLPPSPALPMRCIIVVQVADQALGLLVDAVREVAFLQATEAVPDVAKTSRSAFLSGVARLRESGTLVLLLDPERLLAPGELQALQAV
jgi:purine-binding chemotaxis protein CheW